MSSFVDSTVEAADKAAAKYQEFINNLPKSRISCKGIPKRNRRMVDLTLRHVTVRETREQLVGIKSWFTLDY